MKRFFWVCLLVAVYACGPSPRSLSQIDQYESEDQKILYGILETLQQTLNARDIESWLALYTDDATITYTKNRPTPKQVVMDDVRAKDLSTWNFEITDIKIVSTAIQEDMAVIKSVLRMKTEARTRNHPETYYFVKQNGTWLITKETNP